MSDDWFELLPAPAPSRPKKRMRTMVQVLFTVDAPADWPEAKTQVIQQYAKETFDGAKKWLESQLAGVDPELKLERE